MISASVESKNFKDFMKQLKQTTSKLSPAFRDAGEYMKKETIIQFEKEVDPNGKPWAPLAPATIAKKKTPFKLRETLVMFNTLFYVANDKGLTFGIKDDKYRFHHEGTTRMPARVVIGITDARRGKINQFVIAQIRRVKGKNRR
jgi:hypothetical protein